MEFFIDDLLVAWLSFARLSGDTPGNFLFPLGFVSSVKLMIGFVGEASPSLLVRMGDMLSLPYFNF